MLLLDIWETVIRTADCRKGVGNMTFYEELSRYYDVVFPLNHTKLNFIIKHLQQKSTILDLAAGTGTYSVELAKLGHEVVATDLDKKMIEDNSYHTIAVARK